MSFIRSISQYLLLVTILATALSVSLQASAADTVYIFRHAEKADDGTSNPPLNRNGKLRAKWLTEYILANTDGKITHVYSTDYFRTKQTVQAIADKSKLLITEYNPSDLKALADKIRKQDGTIIIAGHSNTVLETIRELGGKAELAIEHDEFDRLYKLTFTGHKESRKAKTERIQTPKKFPLNE
ncbi:SixA phosphatase family protein [Flocculibacter collagenilyticus]|uniref:SixA phosphatase family protein n=1 Tax=Flocculibacter collagenilyticus TaxID=2744479 RepID=UPI0018F4FEED|nr:phosphoglycerate mutase family protein [Flocculibacter collagenilyticus]